MEIKLALALPRDALSVPVVRKILKGALETLGVTEECIGDIEVALTEACSNVLHHAAGEAEYEVSCGIDGTTCLIEVVDHGLGFDGRPARLAEHTDETGRGLALMRALVDKVSFEQGDVEGTVVHLEKQLEWHPGAPLVRMSSAPTKTGPWTRDDSLRDAPRPR